MHLKNRLTPFGELIAVSARGLFMGNRGILHDEQGDLTSKCWTHKSWVSCTLNYKGYKRTPKARKPNEYTELFFLDEATALAAGHRPCGQCRRKDFNRFVECWIAGNELPEKTTIKQIDTQLHTERVATPFSALIDKLPNGVFVAFEAEPEAAWLLWNGELLKWQPAGYSERRKKIAGTAVILLTPLSTVNAIAAGYIPHVHHNKYEEPSLSL